MSRKDQFRTLVTRLLAAFALALPLPGLISTAEAQIRIAPDAISEPLADLLQRGQSLETENRWSDALTHYEDALREYPGNRDLEQRLDLAKIHYDLGRRYNDASFRRSLGQLTAQQSLDLYWDVMLKLSAHYVAEPEWQRLVVRGTTAFDVALSSEAFVRENLPRVDAARIDGFRRAMYQELSRRAIRSRLDARDAAASIGQLAAARLGLSQTAVILEYTAAAMGGLDEYSSFLTGDQLRDIYAQIEGNFVGLGVELKAEPEWLRVVHVIPGSPAERSGIRDGDLIVSVEGKRIGEAVTSDKAATLLAGPEGSIAALVVVSPEGAPRELRVRREHVDVPSIEKAHVEDKTFGIAYLKLTSFQKTTVRDLDAALAALHRDGMRSLVIDLRGNPGGLLTSAVEVADRFVEQGTIVSTRGRNSQEDFTYAAHRAGTWRIPLVVLIDGDSASASEIFAGAIRDHRRGTIVGDKSYGKGSVQGIFPLNVGGTGVRITTAKFYSPNGHPFSKVGVQPDIVVRHAAKVTEGATFVSNQPDDRDAALEAGLDAARRLVARAP